jgi:DndB-like DNA-sulfur modification-associated protein
MVTETYSRTLEAMEVGEHEAVATVPVQEFLDLTIPGRAFLSKAKNDPLTQRVVDEVREIHDLIQRDLAGQKLKNARGDLPRYLLEEWLPAVDGPSLGIIGPFIVVTPTPLSWVDGPDTTPKLGLRAGQKFIIEDGESRGEAFLWLLEQPDAPEELVEQMLAKRITMVIHHGVPIDTARKWFADINGKAIKVNANLTVARDLTDPYRGIALKVFPDLGAALELDARQVKTTGPEVFTALQARLAVTAVAKGPSVVGYGAGRIPTDDVDFEALETAAKEWFAHVFKSLGIGSFKDKEKVLRSVPVLAAIGAVGKAYYDGDEDARRRARGVIGDSKIDWSVGEQWNGICGKVNPNTNRFAVGSAKEYGNAAFNALTKADSVTWRQIRPAVPETKAA